MQKKASEGICLQCIAQQKSMKTPPGGMEVLPGKTDMVMKENHEIRQKR